MSERPAPYTEADEAADLIWPLRIADVDTIPAIEALTSPAPSSEALRARLAHLYGGEELMTSAIFAVDAYGVYVKDDSGREYIDCASGTFDQPLGHKHPALVAAIRSQAENLAYVGTPFMSSLLVELAEKLVSIAPPGLSAVHLRDITGSTAIEGAIKIAQVATGKRDVITLFGSHHGQTALTTDASGNSFRRGPYPTHYAGMLQVPAPYCLRCFYRQKFPQCEMLCVSRIEQFIEHASSGSIAALIVEPILGNGGNIVPPPGYFAGLRELCDRHGMLLIVDEVQTGMGRLGTMFATEHFGIRPHMMVLAKGLGGPAPRGAILLEKQLQQMPRYQHSSTGASSLLSAATALATIEVLQQPGFLEGVRQRGRYLGDRLHALSTKFGFIAEARGVGFMWGLEIVGSDGKPDVELCNRLVAGGPYYGLMLRSSRYGFGNVLKVRPPLIMTLAEIDEMTQRLEALFEANS